MFTIGDFAAFGQVTPRMLRHYDALGLLRPAVVDGTTGYRYYSADQFSRLNRIVALKDLGFSLQQVAAIVPHAPAVHPRREKLAGKPSGMVVSCFLADEPGGLEPPEGRQQFLLGERLAPDQT